jgi:pyruvate,orthophosphate dikinase
VQNPEAFGGNFASGKGEGQGADVALVLLGLAGNGWFAGNKAGDAKGGEIMEREGVTVPYSVGTMIELPRAALMAGEIAESAAFFSFGTNDLTQTVFGLSRDDAASFIGVYQKLGIFEQDPFVTIDTAGVGELIRIAAERGRAARPGLKLGICGEHGGDPASIRFCREIGLDYVSCSPYRVPIARLAAAQAELAGDDAAATA